MKYKVLVVEDEKIIRQSIVNYLVREGYGVVDVETGEEALHQFYENSFDLILLDIMLPNMNGEEVLREIRETSLIPVIIISALQDELIQLDAFEQKVDDYVVKPFSMNILIHKIAALIRRSYPDKQSEIKYEDIVMSIDNFTLKYHDDVIDLTVKEFEILQVMLLNQGRVYTREELLSIVWGYDYYGDTRNIDVHIKNIRKKIYPEVISTIKGIGYKVDKL